MQLASGEVVFDQARGQMMDARALLRSVDVTTYVNVLFGLNIY